MEQNGLTELSNALPDDEDLPVIHVEICQHPTRYARNSEFCNCSFSPCLVLQTRIQWQGSEQRWCHSYKVAMSWMK